MNFKILLNIKFNILIFILFTVNNIYANIDSLENQLVFLSEDTNKIILLNKISKKYRDINAEKGLEYALNALELSSKLKYKSGTAESYKNIGLNYWRMGTYDIAIDNNLKALSFFEELKDTQGIANTNNNIGLIYLARNDYNKAIDFLNRSINLCLNIKDEIGVARSQLNLAIIYSEQKNFEKALEFHFKSLKGCIAQNDSILESTNYCFIGSTYIRLGIYDSAYKYLSLSKEIFEKINSPNDIAMVNNQLAQYYNKIKEFQTSMIYSNSAFELGEKIGNKYMQMEALGLLSESYSGLKSYEKAYEYHKKFKNLQDTLANEENIRSAAQKEVQYEYEKKVKSLEINQENELYKKSFILYALFIFSGILILVIIIIYIFYRAKTKANKLLIEKKSKIESQQKELESLNQKLTKLNNTKDKFFSIIAHDLKNPVGNYMNITELLHDSYDEFSEDERIEFLKLMKSSSKNLYSLLENLLEWSRSQRDLISFSPELFDLKKITDNTIQLLLPLANNKNINIENRIPENTLIFADSSMINIIIRNLISNSIKFTQDNGHININTKLNSDFIRINISDTGIGMDSDTLKKLFRIDTHITTIGTQKETGTGLGLILCKEFIEKHGGEIWVESEKNMGSNFYFTIPIKSN